MEVNDVLSSDKVTATAFPLNDMQLEECPAAASYSVVKSEVQVSSSNAL